MPLSQESGQIGHHRGAILTFAVLLGLMILSDVYRTPSGLQPGSGTQSVQTWDSASAGFPLQRINASTADDLELAFEQAEFSWPPENTVPPLEVQRFPEDMIELDVHTRKALFFRTLLPLVLAENRRLRQKRQLLVDTFSQGDLDPEDPSRAMVADIAARYRIEDDLNSPAARARLLRRVDEIPVSLALAQGANESGWGTSRFSREANNLFGVWTWDANAGLVPEQRAEGKTHRIRIFPDLRTSVRNYLLTLNTGGAYGELRHLREEMRRNNNGLSGLELASGLIAYSERGKEYVDEVRSMIRSNGLHKLGELRLDEP